MMRHRLTGNTPQQVAKKLMFCIRARLVVPFNLEKKMGF
jgi:hypothetical protein